MLSLSLRAAIFAACFCSACAAWLQRKLTLSLSRAEDSPAVGNANDSIVVYEGPNLPMTQTDRSLRLYIFTTKLEAWLRFADLPYTLQESPLASAPKGQVPFIKHGEKVVADTTFIIEYLQATYAGQLRQSHLQTLSPEQDAVATAVLALLEERLLYDIGYHRYIDSWGWKQMRVIASIIPWPLRPYMVPATRVSMHARLWAQGIARHSRNDVNALVRKHLQSLSMLLGDKAYLFGSAPCEADACMFALLDHLVYGDMISLEIQNMVRKFPNLCQFTQRVRAQYFPETAGASGASALPEPKRGLSKAV